MIKYLLLKKLHTHAIWLDSKNNLSWNDVPILIPWKSLHLSVFNVFSFVHFSQYLLTVSFNQFYSHYFVYLPRNSTEGLSFVLIPRNGSCYFMLCIKESPQIWNKRRFPHVFTFVYIFTLVIKSLQKTLNFRFSYNWNSREAEPETNIFGRDKINTILDKAVSK